MGGGAAGLMCAWRLKHDYCILESNDKVAAKIAISGGGKCNFTNNNLSCENYTGDTSFIKSVLQNLSVEELLSGLDAEGVKYENCKNNQFFCKDGSFEIINALAKKIKPKNIFTNCKVLSVRHDDVFIVQTSRGEFRSRFLVIASGGISYTTLGASDIGFVTAQNFGHAVITPKAALVGFTIQPPQAWFKELSGVSVDACVTVDGHTFCDSVLFTHKGISGPAILNASLYWEKGSLNIDFLPNLCVEELFSDSSKQLCSRLPLPKRFTKAFLASCGIEDKPIKKLTQHERQTVAGLKNYSFAPAGTFGFSKAEITKGGVDTSDIDPKTMQSKIQKGLYFAGEVLNVNGQLGGYNFHWAFACGKTVASALNTSTF